MVYFIIGSLLIFNYVIFKMSSKCSKIEERIYYEEKFNLENKKIISDLILISYNFF